MLKLQRLVGFVVVCGWLSGTGTVHADAVTDWHAIAVQALATMPPARAIPLPYLDLAIVQAAVHDAVQAIERRFQPYQASIPGATGSPAAAAATAAHDVLVAIFPDQTAALDTTYQEYLAAHQLAKEDPGVRAGQAAAAAVLARRANDGRVPTPVPAPFVGGPAPGQWRPTPSLQPPPPASEAPMVMPWLGAVPPFTLKSGDQFRAKPMPPLTSQEYAQNYKEVQALGARVNSTRTPEQTQLAYFYTGNLFILWNRALREIAAAHTQNLGDNARLLALSTLAIADAVIACWESKRHYVFWRPITAIREGDKDGNDQTTGDPTWEPLLNTPPYPDYTSGANNVVGALTRTLELFLGGTMCPSPPSASLPRRTPRRARISASRSWPRIRSRSASTTGSISALRMKRAGPRAGPSPSGSSPTFCNPPPQARRARRADLASSGLPSASADYRQDTREQRVVTRGRWALSPATGAGTRFHVCFWGVARHAVRRSPQDLITGIMERMEGDVEKREVSTGGNGREAEAERLVPGRHEDAIGSAQAREPHCEGVPGPEQCR